MGKNTIPELFIIETLTLENEKDKRHEGELISNMLHLAGKCKTEYFYIRTKKELVEILKVFGESNHRYLHISCHANDEAMDTTFDDLTFSEFSDLLRPYMNNKRVFVSACEMANKNLAKNLWPKTECLSLIGPSDEVGFSDAAAFWVAFYHLMFKENDLAMKAKNIQQCIIELSKLLEVPINYYSRKIENTNGYVKIRTR